MHRRAELEEVASGVCQLGVGGIERIDRRGACEQHKLGTDVDRFLIRGPHRLTSTRHLPHFKQLDLQLQKNFTFAGTTLGLIGSVFNVFNKETVTAVRGSVGNQGTGVECGPGPNLSTCNATLAHPNPTALFNTASSWQRPRRYELGFRVEF